MKTGRYRCRFCGLPHQAVHCRDPRWRANGEYRGHLRVRVIPPGVHGLDLKHDMDGWARTSGERGRRKRWGYYGLRPTGGR